MPHQRTGILLLLLLLTGYASYAQQRCATVEYTDLLERKGIIRQQTDQFENHIQKKITERKQFQQMRTNAGPYRIPVVVHIIHKGEAVGTGTNLSEAQILSQIEVLNDDFKRLNADAVNTPASFQPLAGSLDIEFVLAKRTPEGLPTNGIVRVNGGRNLWPALYDADEDNIEDYKELSYWPSEDYLNIWVLNLSSFYGYAQFPITTLPGLEDETGIAETDGVVILYTVFGTDDAGDFDLNPELNKGRTLTHEVGHFFGLRHIWGDDNGCAASDYVSDTPNQSSATESVCPSTQRLDACTPTAPGVMYQNYMDYTNDACMNLFTEGQADRMTIILEDTDVPRRRSLWESSNGLEDPICGSDPPVDLAVLSLMKPGPVTCQTTVPLSISVKNVSCPVVTSVKVEYTVNGTLHTATLTGLSINPSTEATIAVTSELALSPGLNTVVVSIDKLNGQDDAEASNSDVTFYIEQNTQRDVLPLWEVFESSNQTWTLINPEDGTNWQLLSSSPFGQSARFAGYNNGQAGERSWLVSPVLDFSSLSRIAGFYDRSYAWNGADNDQLQILASTDCGTTFDVLLQSLNGASLATTATTTDPWEPTDENDWLLRDYVPMNALAGNDSVRIAFVINNQRGNNLYLDNIEIQERDRDLPVYTLYRSGPSENSVKFYLTETRDVNLLVADATGRIIEDTTLKGIRNETVPIEGYLPSGLYIIRLQIGDRVFSQKVYFTK
jgi:hypothetical protein